MAALEALLVDKGILDPAAMDAVVAHYEHAVGPMNGAKVVARAWVDPAYRARLLADGTAAIAELGFAGPEGDHMVVVENTPEVHNVVVCTLCSCYPWPVLGPAAQLVQEPAVPLADGARAEGAAGRDGLRRPRRRRDPGVGLVGRGPLSGAPDATRRVRTSCPRRSWPHW